MIRRIGVHKKRAAGFCHPSRSAILDKIEVLNDFFVTLVRS
jgi:hypothetical protein